VSPRCTLGVETGREAVPAHGSRNSAAEQLRFAFTRRSGRAISAKTTLTKASLTLRSGRMLLRTARSTG
jgi:hypothetical protein